MTLLVTPDEMLEAERATIANGAAAGTLMRTAAESIADWLDRNVPLTYRSSRSIVGLAGPGNNGGDAIVALGILAARGWSSRIILLGRDEIGALPLRDDERSALSIGTLELGSADVVLDGVYGVRSRPALSEPVASVFASVNAERSRRRFALVAVDVPSGIDAATGAAADDALRADVTICLGLPKIGLTREPAATLAGDLVLIDIGIDAPVIPGRPRMLTESTVIPMLPRRRATAHKHGTGAVIVVGGAPTYYGAPRLAAEAALRAGAGLVAAAVPPEVVPVLAAQVPEVVLVPLGADPVRDVSSFVNERSHTLRAAVVGPGLGRSVLAEQLLDSLLGSESMPAIRRLPKVIDADALNWMAGGGKRLQGLEAGSAVLTPHPGELARLLGTDATAVLAEPLESARAAAARFSQVVVLKSGYAPVVHPDGDVWLAPRATPELATAGTGDVLAGLIGGLLAQGLTPFDAARAGVYIGALAGRRAASVNGMIGTIARDVINAIGPQIQALTEPEQHT